MRSVIVRLIPQPHSRVSATFRRGTARRWHSFRFADNPVVTLPRNRSYPIRGLLLIAALRTTRSLVFRTSTLVLALPSFSSIASVLAEQYILTETPRGSHGLGAGSTVMKQEPIRHDGLARFRHEQKIRSLAAGQYDDHNFCHRRSLERPDAPTDQSKDQHRENRGERRHQN